MEQEQASFNENKKENKDKLVIVAVVVACVFAVLAGLLYFGVLEPRTKESDTIPELNLVDEMPADTAINESVNVPDDYIEYSSEYGFSFYYPSSWGEITLTEGESSEDSILAYDFSDKSNAQLFLNSGLSDYTGEIKDFGQGDCVGWTFIGDKTVACKAVWRDSGEIKSSLSEISVQESYSTVSSLDTVYLENTPDMSGEISRILFNPSDSKYYGGSLHVSDPSDQDKADLSQIVTLFETTQSDGL